MWSPEKLCLATCLIFLPVRVRCLICLSLKPCNEDKYYFFRPQVGGCGDLNSIKTPYIVVIVAAAAAQPVVEGVAGEGGAVPAPALRPRPGPRPRPQQGGAQEHQRGDPRVHGQHVVTWRGET